MEFAFLAAAALVIFFLYSLNQKFNKLDDSVTALRALKEDIKFLVSRMKTLEEYLKQNPPSGTATPTKEHEPEHSEPTEPVYEKPQAEIFEPSLEERIKDIAIPVKAAEETVNIDRWKKKDWEIAPEPEPFVAAMQIDEKTRNLFDDVPEKSTPKQRDLEKYIGENVINKIGIGILVIGIGFFVKYAIDKQWINETFRTLIGMFCGALLIGLAHRMRKNFKAFSSVLVGGGLAIFYLTISIAFHQYHLFSQQAAFGIMVGITGLAIWLSLAYDRKEIAVLAILGGFGTPFFVSTGEGNYQILFTYLLILNVGMLVIAAVRKWPLLNIVSYVLTVLTYGAWFVDLYFSHNDAAHHLHFQGALFFASAFYLVFFLMNVIYNLKETKSFTAFDYSILLSNSFLFYWVGMTILSQINHGSMQGLFTGVLSVFNFVFAFLLYRNTKADRNFVYMLIGLVLAFISLVGPVQLDGNYITMYWSAEAVIMLFLSQKTGIKLLKTGSVIITALMLISLSSVWIDLYILGTNHLSVLINKGFVTGVFCLLTLQGSLYLAKREKEMFIAGILKQHYQNALLTFSIGLLYMVPLLELVHQVHFYVNIGYEQAMIISLYNFVFAVGLILYSNRLKNGVFIQATTFLAFIALFLYMTLYRFFEDGFIADLFDHKLMGFGSFYIIHLPVFAVVLVLLYLFRRSILSLTEDAPQNRALVYWFTSITIVFMASNELYNFVNCLAYEPGLSKNLLAENISKIGFPVVWGICAFIFIRNGLVKKNRTLRIISMTLLLVTVLKLFIFDIQNVPEVGKIIAFVCLGVVLLIISFMYQKIRNLIFQKDAENEITEEAGEEPVV